MGTSINYIEKIYEFFFEQIFDICRKSIASYVIETKTKRCQATVAIKREENKIFYSSEREQLGRSQNHKALNRNVSVVLSFINPGNL